MSRVDCVKGLMQGFAFAALAAALLIAYHVYSAWVQPRLISSMLFEHAVGVDSVFVVYVGGLGFNLIPIVVDLALLAYSLTASGFGFAGLRAAKYVFIAALLASAAITAFSTFLNPRRGFIIGAMVSFLAGMFIALIMGGVDGLGWLVGVKVGPYFVLTSLIAIDLVIDVVSASIGAALGVSTVVGGAGPLDGLIWNPLVVLAVYVLVARAVEESTRVVRGHFKCR